MKRVLFIVDPQNDFVEGGSLAVEGALDKMNNLALYLQSIDRSKYDKIIVSLDWHPINHCSFTGEEAEWPRHCVEYTNGACIVPIVMNALTPYNMENNVLIYLKGQSANVEEYSLTDNSMNRMLVGEVLEKTDILDICGIVGTVCVKNTINGIISKLNFDPTKINVLLDFTAQFSVEDENDFCEWCNDNNVNLSILNYGSNEY